MKSWADHCSSDEESFNEDTPMESLDAEEEDDGIHHTASHDADLNARMEHLSAMERRGAGGTPVVTKILQNPAHAREHQHGHDDTDTAKQPRPPKVYEWPTAAPFTVFVGNLSYRLENGPMLGEALATVVKERTGQSIAIKDARTVTQNNEPRHRGFGYVEVGSLEEMKLVLDLNNDPAAKLDGRRVQFDTANLKPTSTGAAGQRGSFHNSRRSSSAPDVDGRQFRGGKYNPPTKDTTASNNHQNNADADHHQGGAGRRPSHNDQATPPPPPSTQRPSLQLKPRSKPIEAANPNEQLSSSQSDIFGGAKARDEPAWQSASGRGRGRGREGGGGRGARTGATNANKDHHKQPNNRGPRGGGPREAGGRGGRGPGRGGPKQAPPLQTKKKGGDKPNRKDPAEKKPAVAPNPETTDIPPPKKPTNKFAALNFDSDSD